MERLQAQLRELQENNPGIAAKVQQKRGAPGDESGGKASKKSKSKQPTAPAQLLSRSVQNEDEEPKPWPVVYEDEELKHKWKHVSVKKVFHDCKFIGSTEEEYLLMERLLEDCRVKIDLNKLSKKDRAIQIEAYREKYSRFICKLINDERSKVASALRVLCHNMCKEKGKAYKSQDVKNAARRFHLVTFPTDTEDQDVNVSNQAKNDVIVKKQAIFDYYVEHICGKANGHAWKDVHFCLIPLQGDEDNELISPVTPADEAYYVLVWENFETKWHWERLIIDNGYKYPNNFPIAKLRKKAAPREGGKLTRELDEFSKFTTYKSGSNKYGGWNKEGRARFKQLRASITKARARELDRGLVGEKGAMERLFVKHGMEEKLQRAQRRRGAARIDIEAVGFGGEDDGDFEANDSDEEGDLL